MRFVIVGPGALGCVLAAALAAAGHDVVLLGRPSPRLDALRGHGLTLIDRGGGAHTMRLPVTDEPAVAADADVIVVLVKAGDTVEAMRRIAPYVHATQAILTLQNGLGNAERIREALGEEVRVFPGVTSQAATRAGPRHVIHTGEGPTLIGYEHPNDAAAAAALARAFRAAGWPATAVSDISRGLWRKAAVNAAINGLTALGGFRNGVIAENPDLLDAAEIVAEEAASVARAQGIELGSMRRVVRETATATADNRSSMLQDIDAGRFTEVEAIHGAILAAGAASGVDTPVIRVLAALIRAKEQTAARTRNDD